jgi:hypothetical protein
MFSQELRFLPLSLSRWLLALLTTRTGIMIEGAACVFHLHQKHVLSVVSIKLTFILKSAMPIYRHITAECVFRAVCKRGTCQYNVLQILCIRKSAAGHAIHISMVLRQKLKTSQTSSSWAWGLREICAPSLRWRCPRCCHPPQLYFYCKKYSMKSINRYYMLNRGFTRPKQDCRGAYSKVEDGKLHMVYEALR